MAMKQEILLHLTKVSCFFVSSHKSSTQALGCCINILKPLIGLLAYGC